MVKMPNINYANYFKHDLEASTKWASQYFNNQSVGINKTKSNWPGSAMKS